MTFGGKTLLGGPQVLSAVLCLLMLSASGCGFQLRGQQQTDFAWSELVLDCPDAIYFFCEQLEAQLRQAGTNVLSPEEASEQTPRLAILDWSASRRAITLTADARAAEYELSRGVVFDVTEQEQYLIPRTQIREFQTYRYDTESVLGKEREEREIQETLDQMLAVQLANRLALEKIKRSTDLSEDADQSG